MSAVTEPSTGGYTELITGRILRALQNSDMSLVDLARNAGMSPHDLAATLGGRRGLWFDEAVLLGRALEISVEELFSSREDR